jgi:hypothetical protein
MARNKSAEDIRGNQDGVAVKQSYTVIMSLYGNFNPAVVWKVPFHYL